MPAKFEYVRLHNTEASNSSLLPCGLQAMQSLYIQAGIGVERLFASHPKLQERAFLLPRTVTLWHAVDDLTDRASL